MPRKSLERELAESLDDILFGYPRRGGKRGGPSLREIAVLARRRWAGDARAKHPGRFHTAELVTPLRVYGMCDFQLDRLESLGGDVARRRRELRRSAAAIRALRAHRPQTYDRVLRSWCEDACDAHRQTVAMFRKKRTARGFKGLQPWQFVAQVLWPREAEEFTLRATRELGFPLNSASLAVKYSRVEAANRPLILSASKWYGRNAWRWIERPALFPQEFWWRSAIWDAYRAKKG